MRGIISQKKEKASEVLATHYAEQGMEDHAKALVKIREGFKAGGSAVQDSFWNAWTAYSTDQENFEKVMGNALTHKGSSVVGIAGAFVGASTGMNDIPQRWLNQLALPEEGKNVIEKFVKVVTSRT